MWPFNFLQRLALTAIAILVSAIGADGDVWAKNTELTVQIIAFSPNAMGDMPITVRYRKGSHELSAFYEVWRGVPGGYYTYRYVEATTGVWRPHASFGGGLYKHLVGPVLNFGMNFQFGSIAFRLDNTAFFPLFMTFEYFILHGGFSWSF